MESKVVSHCPLSEEKMKFYDYDLNLDAALNELDMLSTITTSRIDYLKEQELDLSKKKVTKKCSSNSPSAAPLCIVHMNSDFVTQFSVSKNLPSTTYRELPDDSLKTDLNVKCKRRCKKNYRNNPYCIKKKLVFSKLERRHLLEERFQQNYCENKSSDVLAEDRASPPIITRQDSGNKSNPSSPVKSQNSLTSLGCSIFRSRSLDDLEISKLNLNESCEIIASHGEIDTVSQRISKLHVS